MVEQKVKLKKQNVYRLQILIYVGVIFERTVPILAYINLLNEPFLK